ncbi:MAG: hypothetical protein ABWK05_03145 [Pyrobaculum sp.]
MNELDLAWLYAGFFAGVISSAVEEPAYAVLFVFPLMLALGVPPPIVALEFTLGVAIVGMLNIIYNIATTKRRPTVSWTHGGVATLLGVAAGIAMWTVLNWHILKFIAASALIATGVKLLDILPPVEVGGKPLAVLANFVAGFLEGMLGGAPAFALAKAFFGEVEALLPLMRTMETAASSALKHAIILDGALMGIGLFLGQRLVRCGASSNLRKAVGLTILATGAYISTL